MVRLGGVVPSIRQHLTINALCAGLLFIGTIFMASWAAVPRAGPVMMAVCIVLLAASGEGLYAAWDIYSRGRPLSGLLDLNIDAITSWWLRSATIDSLPRSLWYTPQHAAACALSLIALVVACRGGALRPAAGVIAGVALGLALIFSPFLGGSFALVYGAAAAWSSMRSGPRMLAGLLRCGVAAVPVLAALGWCVAAGTFEGAGGAVAVGASPLAMAAPGRLLLLALGPVVTLAVAGLGVAARSKYPWHASLAGLAVGLFMLYFVTLSKEPIWVGWRAGQIILVTIPALIAAFFAKAWDLGYRVTVGIAAAAALTAGLPTTLIDTWNAQDVTNTRMAASFRWTVVVPPDTLAATAWIREHTPPDALVQMSNRAPRSRNMDADSDVCGTAYGCRQTDFAVGDAGVRRALEGGGRRLQRNGRRRGGPTRSNAPARLPLPRRGRTPGLRPGCCRKVRRPTIFHSCVRRRRRGGLPGAMSLPAGISAGVSGMISSD